MYDVIAPEKPLLIIFSITAASEYVLGHVSPTFKNVSARVHQTIQYHIKMLSTYSLKELTLSSVLL